ncbi:MAG: alanine racemase [Chitinivibrionales bacterium]|nr:alanine racemase [Chitinivibrionales bacterium]
MKRPQASGRTAPVIEISLDNLLHNLAVVKKLLPPRVGVIAVVKDRAYGCGAVVLSRTLQKAGVPLFAVATMAEARSLRAGGLTAAILVLGEVEIADLRWAWRNTIELTLNDIKTLQRWKTAGVSVRAHIKVDTGMGRLGILPGETEALVAALRHSPAITVSGVFTHLASGNVPKSVSVQKKLFFNALAGLRAAGIDPAIVHYANSAAIANNSVEGCTHVRPGIMLYGCKSDPARDNGLKLRPVATLKSYIVKLKRVPAGTAVSYGSIYRTARATTIATVALGYGCGYPRALSNKGEVLIGGKRYPVRGRVTMDYIMVDVGNNTDIRVGDEVVAMGFQGRGLISPDEIAQKCTTIAYEILCNLGGELERIYFQKGAEIHRLKGCYF